MSTEKLSQKNMEFIKLFDDHVKRHGMKVIDFEVACGLYQGNVSRFRSGQIQVHGHHLTALKLAIAQSPSGKQIAAIKASMEQALKEKDGIIKKKDSEIEKLKKKVDSLQGKLILALEK